MEPKKPSELKPWLKYTDFELPDVETCNCLAYDYIYEINKNRLEHIAINYYDRKITYGEFFQNIQTVAKAFRNLGVSKGDIVSVCAVMIPEVVYIFYALGLVGATPNMIDPRTSAKGICEYIKEVHSKVVVSMSEVYSHISKAVLGTDVENVVTVSAGESLQGIKKLGYKLKSRTKNNYADNVVLWKDFIRKGTGEDIKGEYDANHAAVIVHTGGTTGPSKGVMLSDKNFNALALQGSLHRPAEDTNFLNIMPPFIAYGFAVGVHTPFVNKLTAVIIPMFDVKKFGKLLLKYRPGQTAGVPAHYQELVKDKAVQNADLSFLKVSGAGGDGINIGAEQEVNDFLLSHNAPFKLSKGYGMTECSSMVTANVREHNKLGSVGYPLGYTNIGIFKIDTDEELDFDEYGEICVSGPNLMLGYYNHPEETAKVLKKHSDGEIWLHTGDIGKMDSDGFVFINSRIKRLIIRHDGFKIFPTVIENVVGTHEDVAMCSAVRVRDKDHVQGDLPLVHVVLKEGHTKSEDVIEQELRKMCLEIIPLYMQPIAYVFREKMPFTNIGKIDYRALEQENY